jgi:hypothetical protein
MNTSYQKHVSNIHTTKYNIHATQNIDNNICAILLSDKA